MKVISFDDYRKNLMNQKGAHIYIQQDFEYDEDGNDHLINLHKVSIVSDGETLERFNVYFGDFLECKLKALKKCSNLSLKPSFVVHDLHKYDYKNKNFLLKIIAL